MYINVCVSQSISVSYVFPLALFFSCLFCPVLTCLFWFYLISLCDYSLNAYFFFPNGDREI